MKKLRLVVLNPTCLDGWTALEPWLHSLDADVVGDDATRLLNPGDIDRFLQGADALILPASRRDLPTRQEMARHSSLKVLSIAASGYDWLDIEAATQHGIIVTNAQVAEGAEVVADLTFGLMLAVARQIPHHDQEAP